MKIIRNGSKDWELMYLTRKEISRLRSNLRKRNVTLMKQCIKDAGNMLSADDYPDIVQARIQTAIQLFDKLAEKLYTVEMKKLTAKTFWFKESYKVAEQQAILDREKDQDEIMAQEHLDNQVNKAGL